LFYQHHDSFSLLAGGFSVTLPPRRLSFYAPAAADHNGSFGLFKSHLAQPTRL
jgi:hypothetical protein